MDTLFSDYLYRIVSWLYCPDLDDYLSGFNPSDSTFYNWHEVHYPMLGIISIIVAALFVVAYYWYDSPAKNRWYHWAIWGVIGGVVNLAIGCGLCYNAQNLGDIPQYVADVNFGNCLMLGVGNLIIAFIFYFLFSLIGKRFSTNCLRTPF